MQGKVQKDWQCRGRCNKREIVLLLQYFAYRKPEIHDRGILEVTFNLWYNDSYPVINQNILLVFQASMIEEEKMNHVC